MVKRGAVFKATRACLVDGRGGGELGMHGWWEEEQRTPEAGKIN